jgi:hypothetical protein
MTNTASNTNIANNISKPATPFDILKESSPTIYISGPVTGLPEWNVHAFTAAETMLTELSINCVNPHKIVDWTSLPKNATPPEEWAFAMKQDLKGLMGCNAVIMLPDWGKSVGATWEFLNAKTLGMPVFQYIPHQNIFTAPSFELIIMTKPEYIELFYSITLKIMEGDLFILNKLITK